MKHDIIIDFETLGKGTETDNFIVLSVAYTKFVINEESDFEDLVTASEYVKFDTQEQLDLGWKAEKDTLEWWKAQPKDIQNSTIKPHPNDETLEEFTNKFIKYIGAKRDIERIWCRGTDFDMPILKRIFREVGLDINSYINYNAATDIRSYVRGVTGFTIKDYFIPPTAENINFKKHVASHDCAMDIMRIQYLSNS